MSAFDLKNPKDLEEAITATYAFERTIVQEIARYIEPRNTGVVVDWSNILTNLEKLITSTI